MVAWVWILSPISRSLRSYRDAGSDVQAISMTAQRHGESYILNGAKLWVTNGATAHFYAVLARTDPDAQPSHRGMSVFLVEKGEGTTGLSVGRLFEKLGYKGVDTAELIF